MAVSGLPEHSVEKGPEEESGPCSSDPISGRPSRGPRHAAVLQEKQRTLHQTSEERLSLRSQGGQTARLPQVLQRRAEGNALQETLRLRVALLRPRGRGGSGPSRLPRHHQAAHGPEHHQGESPSSAAASRCCNRPCRFLRKGWTRGSTSRPPSLLLTSG